MTFAYVEISQTRKVSRVPKIRQDKLHSGLG